MLGIHMHCASIGEKGPRPRRRTHTTMSTTKAEKKESILAGFREFVARGNMIDMAVGVVMGAAVTGVVKSIVNSFINPLIAMIFHKSDMSGLLAFTFRGATISFGAILNEVINFFAVAAAVYFCIIVPINKLHDMTVKHLPGMKNQEEEEKEELTDEQKTVKLLGEIRDELQKANARGDGSAVLSSVTGAESTTPTDAASGTTGSSYAE